MTVSFLLPDEFDEHTERVLGVVRDSGAFVPGLWQFEVCNALRTAEARGRLSEAAVTNAIRALKHLNIDIDSLPLDSLRVIDIARNFSLSAYDASYLWLAMDSNLPLATRDTRLAESAASAGVALV